ncbi:efflux RND transporter periplasmic adaptor subunit [Flavisolibacter sp. BT320]|nr:efflux RND transporter periplasmic adaptor subunit [Flavisolibacter longurius]
MKNSFFFSIIFLGVFACSNEKDTVAVQTATTAVDENVVTLTDAEMNMAGMAVGKPEKGVTTTQLRVAGTIDVPPQNIVSVSFPLGGYLVSTRLMPGMYVSRGQVLGVMQDPAIIQMQQDYLVARSRAGFLQKEYERQRQLNATKTTSDKVLEGVQSEYQTQRILAGSLREKLGLVGINAASLTENTIRRTVTVNAPISGYVSAVNVNIGKYVNPSDVLFELINPADIHVALKVFEKDLNKIEAGQRVEVTTVNNPGRTYEARVKLISRNLDNDRSATVHCHFTGANKELLPGMFANAVIETTSEEAITVPEEAVVLWGNNHYLFVQEAPGKFRMQPVVVGSTHEGKTAVTAEEGDLLSQTVLTANAYTALMKLQNKAEE